MKIESFKSFIFFVLWTQPLLGVSIPKKLSEWKVFLMEGDKISLDKKTFPYDLVNSLFTDYALKFRTLTLPEGSFIEYQDDGTLKFPVGTILTKTFSYRKSDLKPHRETSSNLFVGKLAFMNKLHLVETRVLVKRENKWESLPYVWEGDGRDAKLKAIGASFSFSLEEDLFTEDFVYRVPNMNQCISCHVMLEGSKEVFGPIGVRLAKNLNRPSSFDNSDINQLEKMKSLGLIKNLPDLKDISSVSHWSDETQSIENRVKAYLDINCAHCHSRFGPGSTSGLFLNYENTDKKSYGFCKKPVASGNGSVGGTYDISPGDAEDSILYLRMNSKTPSVMMPELGRSLVHREAVQLVAKWIAGMDSACD